MKKITLIFLFFVCISAFSQSNSYLPNPQYPELFKTIPLLSDEDPTWVHLMYAENVNYYELETAYILYYKDVVFSKNTHTQNFKQFCRIIKEQQYILDDGTIYIPTLNEIKGISSKNKLAKNTGTNSWTPIGPFKTYKPGTLEQKSSQVNIYTFSQSLSNPNVLFAGSETSGVFKSTDKGLNWNSIGDNFFDDGAIEAVTIDPTNENIVYVGTKNNIFKTTDGGSNWATIYTNSSFKVNAIIINPNNTQIVLCTGLEGLLRSDNAGSTWTPIFTDECYDIKFKTDDPNTIFLAKKNATKNISEILKSTDAGFNFIVKDTGWFFPLGGVAQSTSGARIGVTNADANRIYVILIGNENDSLDGGVDDNNYIGIYRSDNAADTWSTPYDGNGDGNPDNEPGGPYSDTHWCLTSFNKTGGTYNQGFYDLAIDVSDTDANKFLVGSLNLFKSEDGGVTYTSWGGYQCTGCGSEYRHPDIQDIEINGNDVWVATDGGIDVYDANLAFVESRNKGINGSNYWGFDQGWNYDILVGGRYHNGNAAYYQPYGTGNFISLGGGEAPTGYVNKGENKKVYHSDISGKSIPDIINGTVTDIPKFTLFPNEHYYLSSRSEIENDPRYWNVLYLGKDNKLWKSEDSGLSFNLVYQFGTDTSHLVKSIEISRANPSIIFLTQQVATGGKLWKSMDSGATWTDVTIPANHSTMQISLNSDNILYLVLNNGGSNANKVFKSTDFGANWTNLTSAALNGETMNYVQVQEGTDGGVYLTSTRYIWYRNNTHSDWQVFSTGLPLHLRTEIIKPFYRDGKLRISSNRGIWERDFFEVSTPKAQPMVSQKTSNCGREIVQFEDFSTLNHTNATWNWSFPGAATISSTSVRNPQVTYTTPGSYNVTLTVTDGNGASNSKTVENMVAVGESYCAPEPNAGMALQLNSSSQYATNSNVLVSNITNFTFTAWIKPNGLQPDYSGILSLSSGNSNEKNVLNFKQIDGQNQLGLHWNGSLWSTVTGLIFPENEWSFIALTVSPTEIKLYLNDEKYTKSFASAPFELNNIILGRYYDWSSRNMTGLLEEATFWNRTLTDDEIYLSRHLTLTDVSDTSIIAHYQFNHNENLPIIYDKKGTHDLTVTGGAVCVTSNAPIGSGKSQVLTVNSGGLKDFSEVNLKLNFPNAGTYPNGKIVATKINNNPSKTPLINTIDQTYWVINNYGSTKIFSALDQVTFSNITNIETENLSNIKLFKRSSNSDETVDWGSEIATATNLNTTEKSATFGGSSITSFSQFYVGSGSTLAIEDATISTLKFGIYPNPVLSGNKLNFTNLNEDAKFTLFSIDGKEVCKSKITKDTEIAIPKVANGLYFYIVETASKIYQGKLVIK